MTDLELATELVEFVEEKFGSKIQNRSKIQSLWAGYGDIIRLELENGMKMVAKYIVPAVREDETDALRAFKVRSYQVEESFYQHYGVGCKGWTIAKFYGSTRIGKTQIFLLEDLDDLGYTGRRPNQCNASPEEIQPVLDWLAAFHAQFMHSSEKQPTKATPYFPHIWHRGTYWNLEQRPDSYENLEKGSPIRERATDIDKRLMSAKYKTMVHGDAKSINFCFDDANSRVAAVDFQYVGEGVGIRDVWYLFTSCLEDIESKQGALLDFYFSRLRYYLGKSHSHWTAETFDEIESEWRELYPYAIADLERFILGWRPKYYKLTDYTRRVTEQVLAELS